MESGTAETGVAKRGEFHNGTHFITIHPLESRVGTYLIGKIANWEKKVEVQPHFNEIERLNRRIKDVSAWKRKIARARSGKAGEPLKAISRVIASFNEMVRDNAYHASMINEVLKSERNHVFHIVGRDGIRPGRVFSKIPDYAFAVNASDLKNVEQMLKDKSRLGDTNARESAFAISGMLKEARKSISEKPPRTHAKHK